MTTKLSSITQRSFCRGLAAIAVLPLTARCGAITPGPTRDTHSRSSWRSSLLKVNVELGKKLDRELIELPGGHVGFLTQPAEFAREFLPVLARRQKH